MTLVLAAGSGLVQIVSRWPKTGDKNDWSAPLRDAPDWKATVPAFQDVAMCRYSLLNLKVGGQADQLESPGRLLQRDYPATNMNLSTNLVPLRQQTVHQVNEPPK